MDLPPAQWKFPGSPPAKMLLWVRSQSRLMLGRASKSIFFQLRGLLVGRKTVKFYLCNIKIVPDHVYPRGTRDIFVASLSNHSVSCGSVVPCVETSRLRMSSSRVTTSGSQKKIWISWKDKIEGTDRRQEKRKPVQTKLRMISFFPILVGLQLKPLSAAVILWGRHQNWKYIK